MRKLFDTVWREARSPGAPGPLRRDWILVAIFVFAAIVEGLYTDIVMWRPMTIVLTIVLALMLPWRRTHPLAMAATAFGLSAIVQLVALTFGVNWSGLNCNLFVVIFPYALLRWGSGREAILGLALIAVSFTIAMSIEQHSWLEFLGASLFLLFPAALGATVRYQDSAHRNTNEQIRLKEREQLARELHDTIAHHVSAIAIQAQAGQSLAATQPHAPVEILGKIEEAASRTLSDMRQIVSMLRDESDAVQAPAATLADIKRLAHDNACPLQVNVDFSGDLAELNATLESSLFRLAQEAVTNAARHARGARSVDVNLSGDAENIRLTVVNDGDIIAHQAPAGLGLRGMAERVALLGGSVSAEPADDQDLVRTGLCMILDVQPDIEVIGEAADGQQAVELARELRPDVCLFDIRMPKLDGIEAVRLLAGPEVSDPLPIVIITTFDLDAYVHAALKAGARGFLLKDAGPDLLTQSIRAAASGDALIAPSITARLLEKFADLPTDKTPTQPIEALTTREEQVLLTVARGRTNVEIADELCISLSTVKTHLASLMQKLSARNRVEIAMWAHETGRIRTDNR